MSTQYLQQTIILALPETVFLLWQQVDQVMEVADIYG